MQKGIAHEIAITRIKIKPSLAKRLRIKAAQKNITIGALVEQMFNFTFETKV